MEDYVLVLNAGSSSLKFCVYQRRDAQLWQLDARGQIEGVGTAPRLKAKWGQGGESVDDQLGAAVKDIPSALDHLAGWLRAPSIRAWIST